MNPTPPYDIQALRRKIPLLRRFIPMNNCSQSPQMAETRAAAQEYLDSWNHDGMDWDRWLGEVDAARASFARLINASAEEIAISSSVSQAVSSVASALDYSGSRKTLVATEAEFPTVGHVWLAQHRRGTRVDWVPVREGMIPLEEYERVLSEETLLVSACQACYQTGFKQDLEAVASKVREVGALLLVDAYQALGSCSVDVKGLDLDFLVSGNVKYLMGPPGIAFLYVKPSVAERLEPQVTGWFGRSDPFAYDPTDLTWAAGARRLDTGTPPIFESFVSRAAMEVLSDIGLASIESWTETLSKALIDGGRDRGLDLMGPDDPKQKAPTTAFRVLGDSHEVEAQLRHRGVLVSARGPAIRLAPHFYSTLDDVEIALDELAQVLEPRTAVH